MPLVTSVRLREAELVVPAKATPRELKPLSDIDDQESLRMHVPLMQFYPGPPGGGSRRDPAGTIREALRQALVYYYPWAGRLREGPHRKLVVDCTGEGVFFVEADADVGLREIGLACDGGFLRPPFPKELLMLPADSLPILHSPLLLFQITKLACGGFVMAMSMNHTMADAFGIVQFMTAIAELARGASRPSVLPVWKRNLLLSRDPPRVTFTHPVYDKVEGTPFPAHHDGDPVVDRSFFFGPNELSSLRHRLEPHLVESCSTYERLSAFLWRCRTAALSFDSSKEVRYIYLANTRSKLKPPLPAGYYGNSIVLTAAISTAEELTVNSLDYAVDLIKKAKAEVTEEYIQSATDLLATRGRPLMTLSGSWVISDNRHAGYLDIDFGWGMPVYGGPCSAMVGAVVGAIGFLVKGVNGKGENGLFALVCLPASAMERFAREVDV
ncbi:hypothetical protein V2J09_015974 [Rumex salicifolius]